MSRPRAARKSDAPDADNANLKLGFLNFRTLGWAMFLGCSWTWCIGMFLPVLLVRDFGLWGFVIFALPNVVGAAAMGWVCADPQRSQRIVARYGVACGAFSAVTIAFHIFFTLWFVPRLVGLPIASTTFAILAIYLLITALHRNWDLWAAVVVCAISLSMLALFIHSGPPGVPRHGAFSAVRLVWLAPVCMFGFALCPYLDLTFHRACREIAPPDIRTAFGWGFGFFFLMMIVFSLIYAAILWPLLQSPTASLRSPASTAIGIHMIVQTAFTLSLHARAIVSTDVGRGRIFAFLLLWQIALFLGLATPLLPRYRALDPGEVIYRVFMGFYGLVFPAYVWICMIPPGKRRPQDQKAAIRAFAIAVLIAAPMFWMGFIEHRLPWLAPGVAVVLLARFAVARSRAASTLSLPQPILHR